MSLALFATLGSIGPKTGFDWASLFTSAIVAAVISGTVAAIGQWVLRQNARLAAEISRENAELAADISRKNASLTASLEVATTLAKSRQDWINLLREDMAQFVALSAERSRRLSSEDVLEHEGFARMIAVSARVRMRMNPKDQDFDQLLELMRKCSLSKQPGEIGKATGEFVSVSQGILKREWDVLKVELRDLASTGNEDV